jgi:hypothetical protein
MCYAHNNSRSNLCICPQVLYLVIITDGAPVYVAKIIVIVANTVTTDSLQQDELSPAPQPCGVVERQFLRWFKEPFSWLKLFLSP